MVAKGAAMDDRDTYLAEQFRYYLDNQDKLVEQYAGKHIVIKDQQVIGAYDSEAEAIGQTTREHEPGTFIVQKCEPGDEEYTQVFHSRVAFA